MGQADYLSLGTWNSVCSMCGHKFKANQLTKNWQGQYRCAKCQESRQPQDFVRAVPDVQTPPWTQPQVDSYVFADFIITEQSSDTDPEYITAEGTDYQPFMTETI